MTHPKTFAQLVATVGITACSLAGCGDSGSTLESGPDGGIVVIHQSLAPLCSDLVTDQAPNELFAYALIDADAISDAVVFGDMEPSSPQEILNFELGFYVPGSDVALVSPADLYIESIERSYHSGNDVTDFGLAYHVCSYLDGNTRKPAVYGNFAHVTTVSADLQALFDAEYQKFQGGMPSAVLCSGDADETCTLNMNMLRDQLGDPDYALVVAGGAALGTAGPAPGKTGPAGIDANLLDVRKNDYAGNYYINPNRLGAEEGPGAAWRYGACTYDYFAEPYRSQYLAKIRYLGQPRVSADHPCGTVEVDEGAEGTVGGVWALAAAAEETMGSDLGGPELDAYLSQLIVMADHLVAPDTKMMMSTHLDSLANFTGEASAVEFDKAVENDADWNGLVNVPFKQTVAGSIYCYSGTRLGGFEQGYYFLEVSEDGATLTVERLEADCTETKVASRAFNPESDAYHTFAR